MPGSASAPRNTIGWWFQVAHTKPDYVGWMSEELGPYGPCPVCNVKVTDIERHHTGKCLVTQCGHPVVEATEPGDYRYRPYYF